jgi:hypothetical protein
MAGPFFTSVGLPHVLGVYSHAVAVDPKWGVTKDATILAMGTEVGGSPPCTPIWVLPPFR